MSKKYFFNSLLRELKMYAQKLASLFTTFNAIPLVTQLQSDHVIAGGSIVWLLNDFVPAESVGDIDVFINGREAYIETLDLLKNRGAKIYTSDGNKYQNASVFEARFKGEQIAIQLILFKYETPLDLISNFDFDFVQCALHENEIYRTGICIKSHQTRKIKYYVGSVNYNRLFKAINKGFMCPLSGIPSKAKVVRFDDPKAFQLSYMKTADNINPVKLGTFEVQKLDIKEKFKNRYTYGQVDITYNNCSDTFIAQMLVLSINVTEDLEHGFYKIQPIKFGNLTVTLCKSNVQLNFGEQKVVANLYSTYDRNAAQSLRLRVHEIGTHQHLQCTILDNLEVNIHRADTKCEKIKFLEQRSKIEDLLTTHQKKLDDTSQAKFKAYKTLLENWYLWMDPEDIVNKVCKDLAATISKIKNDRSICRPRKIRFRGRRFFDRYCSTIDEMVEFVESM